MLYHIACFKDELRAWKYYYSLPKGHQVYFSKMIETAKTIETKSNRIANCILYLSREQGYEEIILGFKQ